jgi:hypothetical protein
MDQTMKIAARTAEATKKQRGEGIGGIEWSDAGSTRIRFRG